MTDYSPRWKLCWQSAEMKQQLIGILNRSYDKTSGSNGCCSRIGGWTLRTFPAREESDNTRISGHRRCLVRQPTSPEIVKLINLLTLDSPSFDMQGPALSNLPKYLAQTGYRNPENPVDGPWQYGHKTPLHFFDWLVANPKTFSAFNNHMSAYSQGRPSWMDPDFYPTEERLIKGFEAGTDSVLLVDQAGGLGHDLEELCRKLPHAPGRLILQDQAKVIETVKADLDPRITPMAHDIFTPQPIQGKIPITLLRDIKAAREAEGVSLRRPCLLHALHPPRLAR